MSLSYTKNTVATRNQLFKCAVSFTFNSCSITVQVRQAYMDRGVHSLKYLLRNSHDGTGQIPLLLPNWAAILQYFSPKTPKFLKPRNFYNILKLDYRLPFGKVYLTRIRWLLWVKADRDAARSTYEGWVLFLAICRPKFVKFWEKRSLVVVNIIHWLSMSTSCFIHIYKIFALKVVTSCEIM